MDVHRARFHLAIETPDALQQPIAGEHAIAVFDEEAEQLEFAARQSHRRAGHRDRDRVEVDDDAAGFVGGWARRCAAMRCGRRSTARTRATSSRRLNGLVT